MGYMAITGVLKARASSVDIKLYLIYRWKGCARREVYYCRGEINFSFGASFFFVFVDRKRFVLDDVLVFWCGTLYNSVGRMRCMM